ncbi:unnamed protein product [Mycena citricolor]|uniref:DUF6534 domain-containing protein n=1 Tax=Mycena citricolor TaxID=2018698 RepID=A0AAD2K502_9AGAR|nr:unnamed protein product [Mycena citricolor]
MPATSALSNIGNGTIPLFVGTLVNVILFGVLLVQVYIYTLAFPRDRPREKALVFGVLVIELLQTTGDIRDKVRIFGTGWGNMDVLDQVGWVWFSVPVLGSMVAAAGQTFFAYRISIFSRATCYRVSSPWSVSMPSLPLTSLLTHREQLAVVQCGAGIGTGVQISQRGRFSNLQFNFFKVPVAWLASTAVNDIIIVAGTCYYLLKARTPGFTQATEHMLGRVIKVTALMGFICAGLALIDLSLFISFPGESFHLGVCMGLSKVYSNSILLILNSRARLSLHREDTSAHAVSLSVNLNSQGSWRPQSHSKATRDSQATEPDCASTEFGHGSLAKTV